MDRQPSWGPLAQRFGGEPRPRKLLALDGGGIRGILTLQVLIKMESLLAQASGHGERFRLRHFFDYIGGTSIRIEHFCLERFGQFVQ